MQVTSKQEKDIQPPEQSPTKDTTGKDITGEEFQEHQEKQCGEEERNFSGLAQKFQAQEAGEEHILREESARKRKSTKKKYNWQ